MCSECGKCGCANYRELLAEPSDGAITDGEADFQSWPFRYLAPISGCRIDVCEPKMPESHAKSEESACLEYAQQISVRMSRRLFATIGFEAADDLHAVLSQIDGMVHGLLEAPGAAESCLRWALRRGDA